MEQIEWDKDRTMSNRKQTAPAIDHPRIRMLATFKAELEAKRIRIDGEIGSYPSPIPACDAQFNYLLKERSDVKEKLRIVEALLATSRTEDPDVRGVEALAARLRQMDPKLAERLRSAG